MLYRTNTVAAWLRWVFSRGRKLPSSLPRTSPRLWQAYTASLAQAEISPSSGNRLVSPVLHRLPVQEVVEHLAHLLPGDGVLRPEAAVAVVAVS